MLFRSQSLIASEIVEELKPLISTNGAIQAFKNTNRIEAVDTAANLLQVFRVLSEEQSDGVLRNLAREFPLEHVRAENVRDQLAKFLDLESATPIDPQEDASGSNNRAQQQMIQAQLAAAQGQTDGSSPPSPTKKEIHLIANHRRNSIIANASPDKMAIIAAFIALVDVEIGRAHV